jgi:hypothetical protein
MWVSKATYTPRHSMHLRVRRDVLDWLITKGGNAEMPPSTYANKVLEDAANIDLMKDEQDGTVD